MTAEQSSSPSSRHPSSDMMGFGYRPEWSEGSLKPPIFQTSTFVFESAAEGKRFFEVAYGLREAAAGEQLGLIYSRINNPGTEILEARLCRWEKAERSLSFASGMAAISTTMLAHLRPGDVMAYSEPIYGGTDHVVRSILPQFGITTVGITAEMSEEEVLKLLGAHSAGGRVAMLYLETPANPTNSLFDIAMARRVANRLSSDGVRPVVAVDNTFLGPLWQNTLEQGADISIYSATKHLGGHSDLIAGAIVGNSAALEPVGAMRTFLGTMLDPWTAWLLTRSLETLELRMRRATDNAIQVAQKLNEHEKVQSVSYLGLLNSQDPEYALYKRQCSGPGSMVAIEFADEREAFAFMDALEMIKLAVSLGGTESLAEHPATMTHAGVDPAIRLAHGVTAGLVRLSIGVEHIDDLLADITQALTAVDSK